MNIVTALFMSASALVRITGKQIERLNMKIEVLKGKSGKWYWRIVSTKNGKVICHSESYSSRTKASQTVRSMLKWMKQARQK